MESNILEDFKKSSSWDHRYNIPLIPAHNNPLLYCAYSFKLINKVDPISAAKILPWYVLYVKACEIKKGLYYRWPNMTGGPTSHDELMGAAYMSQIFAKDILKHLRSKFGCYDNGSDPKTKYRFFRYNLYRFPWFIVFLKASSGEKLNPIYKLIFSLFLRQDAYTYKSGDEGGRLRIWLMLDLMKTITPDACEYWLKQMSNKKITLKNCFKIYFPNNPEYNFHALDFSN